MGRDKETHNRVSDIMSDDISSLKEQMAALSAECAELRTMVAQMSADMAAASGAAGEAATHPQPEPDAAPHLGEFPPRRPFDVWYDFQSEECKIYLPPKSVMVGDKEATYADGTSNDVATLEPAGTVYCHVSLKSQSGDEYEYEFDSSSSSDDAAYVFPVVSFSSDRSEVVAQHATGSVALESLVKKRYAADRDSETPHIDIDATSSPSIQLHGDGGYLQSNLNDGSPEQLLKDGDSGMELSIAADGGSHSVDIRTSDATQGDVSIQECNYYEDGSGTPKVINVLASEPFDIGAVPDVDVVTGAKFKIENNKLVATLSTCNLRTGDTDTVDVDVCDVHDLDVVINTDYTNPNFTQQKQSVTVIGEAPSDSDPAETVFTTTPLSSELGS